MKGKTPSTVKSFHRNSNSQEQSFLSLLARAPFHTAVSILALSSQVVLQWATSKTAFGCGTASRVTGVKIAFACANTALTSLIASGMGAEKVTPVNRAMAMRFWNRIVRCVLVLRVTAWIYLAR